MQKMIITLIFLLLIFNLYSKENNKELYSTSDVKKYSDSIIELIKENNIEKAFEELKKHWPFPESEMDSLKAQTIKQFGLLESRFGKVIDYSLFNEKEVKNIFYRLEYIIKYDYHIIRWEFTFYKPKDKWLLNSINWDDKLPDLH